MERLLLGRLTAGELVNKLSAYVALGNTSPLSQELTTAGGGKVLT